MNKPITDQRLITEAVELPSVSVIIPAFNEARYILETIERLRAAERHVQAAVQILVVDNASDDGTPGLAQSAGATVVHEPEHNIARVRNTGAANALHDVLIFLDADTQIPRESLLQIARAMADPDCVGGALDAVHQPESLLLRAYLKLWRLLGLLGGMAQGACQFCRRSVFQELGGYDETQYVGEDVDFYWRLKRLALRRGLRTCFIRDLQVVPSPRRFDRWPLWRTLLWTNPLVILLLRRRRTAWAGWYREVPR